MYCNTSSRSPFSSLIFCICFLYALAFSPMTGRFGYFFPKDEASLPVANEPIPRIIDPAALAPAPTAELATFSPVGVLKNSSSGFHCAAGSFPNIPTRGASIAPTAIALSGDSQGALARTPVRNIGTAICLAFPFISRSL